MPYLSPVLTFSAPASALDSASASGSDLLPVGTHVHVTDTLLSTPGTLVLAHFAQGALLPRPARAREARSSDAELERRRVLWVGCDGQGRAQMSAVLHKAGLSAAGLSEPRGGGAYVAYLDALDTCLSSCGGAREALRELYGAIAQHLPLPSEQSGARAGEGDDEWADWVVIVDDISALAWSLVTDGPACDTGREVGMWAASLARLCQERHAALVTLQHATHTMLGAGAQGAAVDDGDEALLRAVVGAGADVWVEVRHLASGRAPDVSGELAVHALGRRRGVWRRHVWVARGADEGLLFRLRPGGGAGPCAGSASAALPPAWAELGLSSRQLGVLRDAHASVAAASRAAAFWTPGEAPR